MSARRGPPRGRHSAASHERWLVSYADLITLLFALFVVMYASSRADASRFRAVADGLRRAFAEGVMPRPKEGAPETESRPATPGGSGEGAPRAGAADDGGARVLRDRLMGAVGGFLGEGGSGDSVSAEVEPEGLVLKLGIRGLYAEGKAIPEADVLPLLERLGRELLQEGSIVRLEGHSASNEAQPWMLGASRAAWLLERWVKVLKWDPARLSISSYGATRPLLDESAGSKAHEVNRRIEIRVLKSR